MQERPPFGHLHDDLAELAVAVARNASAKNFSSFMVETGD